MANRRRSDLLLLLLSAVLLVVVLTSSFWIAGERHINPAWVFAAWGGLLFFVVVGWGYRRNFKSLNFCFFFLGWMVTHIWVFLLVLAYLGFLYYLPFLMIELWIGYAVALRLFGPPRRLPGRFEGRSFRSDSTSEK